MKHVKVLNYCWTCEAEHDLGDRDVRETGIKCEQCGGFVVSPSGKVKIRLVPTAKIFKIDDGETHWIAANTKEEAIEYFLGEYDGEQPFKIKEDDPENWNKLDVRTEDNQKTSLLRILMEMEHIPNVLASSVY